MKRLRCIYGLLLIACLAGCARENPPFGEGDPVDLEVRVGKTRSNTENGSDEERKIERIRVLVFYADNGLLDTQVYDENPGGFSTIPIVMDMTVITGDKAFCVIANEPTGLKTTLDGIATLSDLKQLTVSDENKYNTAGESLLMTLVQNSHISIHHTGAVDLPIARAMGKVRMTMVKDVSNTHTVTLKSIQVVNTPVSSRILEGNPVDPPTLTALTAENVFSPDEITVATPVEMTPLYLYEHYWGTGLAGDASKNGEATSLEMIVEVEKTPGSPKEETYRIPLIGAFENGDPVYSVVRNTIADLKIIYNEGLTVIYTVLPWEDEEYEKVPGEDDGNRSITDWVSPNEYNHVLE